MEAIVPTFIFPGESFVKKLLELNQVASETTKSLLLKLGVRSTVGEQVVVLAIGQNTFDAFDSLVDLIGAVEDLFPGKELDHSRIRLICYSSIEDVANSPFLERASFIYFPGDDIPCADEYPELAKVLPFFE